MIQYPERFFRFPAPVRPSLALVPNAVQADPVGEI
jgi:hypothetical protein